MCPCEYVCTYLPIHFVFKMCKFNLMAVAVAMVVMVVLPTQEHIENHTKAI